MRIVFIGPPGAGKGTQSERLAERLGVTRLSTGDVLRQAQQLDTPAGREIKQRLDEGRLVSDDLVLRIVADRLAEADCRHGYLFDGFPRTLPQAVELDGLLADHAARLDAALELVVPEDELFRRLAGRGRQDDDAATIRKRLRDYADLTAPLSGYYDRLGLLRKIDGVGEPDKVYGRLLSALDIA
ncbi:MAG: adenylate kinase [Planctomycetota bacterium]